MQKSLTVCELCLEAMSEEVAGDGLEELSEAKLARLAADTGAEIPDHNCQAVENAKIKCDCACRNQ